MTDMPLEGAETSAAFELLNKRINADDFQRAWRERLAMLKAARDYYDGKHPRPLKVRRGDKDPNVIVNFCRKIVNASVAWLFGGNETGEMLKMELEEGEEHEPADDDDELEPGGERAESEAEAWLRQVWQANGGARLLQRIGRRASKGGHGFVKILPADDPDNKLDVPAIVPQKLDMVAVLTEPHDTDTAEAYVIQWTEKRLSAGGRLTEVKVRQIIAKALDGERPWAIARFEDTGRGRDRWVIVQGPDPWPYAWAPIVDWQNIPNDDGYYGLSDLEDLTVINDAINFAVSNTNRILYIHGHPRTVGTGFEAGEVQDTAIDSFWTIANKDAKVQNLEMKSDLGSAFAFIQFLSQSFYNIGRDLDIASLQDKIGQVTNFGLRVLANLALSKLDEKRLSYGEAIIKINRALLELGGFPVQDTKLHWRNPLPEDEKEEVERLQIERDMAIVSKQTAAEERGRDWETEKDRIEQERSEAEDLGGTMLAAFERGGTFRDLRSPRRSPAAAANEQGG